MLQRLTKITAADRGRLDGNQSLRLWLFCPKLANAMLVLEQLGAFNLAYSTGQVSLCGLPDNFCNKLPCFARITFAIDGFLLFFFFSDPIPRSLQSSPCWLCMLFLGAQQTSTTEIALLLFSASINLWMDFWWLRWSLSCFWWEFSYAKNWGEVQTLA